MRKIGILLAGLAIIILCGSCGANKFCPAYAHNNIEIEEKV